MQSSSSGMVTRKKRPSSANMMEERAKALILALQNRSIKEIDIILTDIITLRAIMFSFDIWVNGRAPFDINFERYNDEGLKWFASLEGIIFNLSLIEGGEHQVKRVLRVLAKHKKYINIKKPLIDNLLCMLETDDFCVAYEHNLDREPQLSKKKRITLFKNIVNKLSCCLHAPDFNEFIQSLCKTTNLKSNELFVIRASLPIIFTDKLLISNLTALPLYNEDTIICNEKWFKTLNGFVTVLLFEVFDQFCIEQYLPKLVGALEIIFKENTFEFINSIIEFIGSDDFVNVYRLPKLVKRDIELNAYKKSTQELIAKWHSVIGSCKKELRQLRDDIELTMHTDLMDQWKERKKHITKILTSLRKNKEKPEAAFSSGSVMQNPSKFNVKNFCEALYNKGEPLSLVRCEELRAYLPAVFSNLSQLNSLGLYQLEAESTKVEMREGWFFSFEGFLITLFYHVLTIDDIYSYWPKIIACIEYRYRDEINDEPLSKFISNYVLGMLVFISSQDYQHYPLNRMEEKRVGWKSKAELMKRLVIPASQQETNEEDIAEHVALELLTPPCLVFDNVVFESNPDHVDSGSIPAETENQVAQTNKRKRQSTKLKENLNQDVGEQNKDSLSLAAATIEKKLAVKPRKASRKKVKAKPTVIIKPQAADSATPATPLLIFCNQLYNQTEDGNRKRRGRLSLARCQELRAELGGIFSNLNGFAALNFFPGTSFLSNYAWFTSIDGFVTTVFYYLFNLEDFDLYLEPLIIALKNKIYKKQCIEGFIKKIESEHEEEFEAIEDSQDFDDNVSKAVFNFLERIIAIINSDEYQTHYLNRGCSARSMSWPEKESRCKQLLTSILQPKLGKSLNILQLHSEDADKGPVTMEEQEVGEQTRKELDSIQLFPSTLQSIPEGNELVIDEQSKTQSTELLLSSCGFFSSGSNLQANRLKLSLMQTTGHLSQEDSVGATKPLRTKDYTSPYRRRSVDRRKLSGELLSNDPALAAPVNQLSSLLFEDKVLELPDIVWPFSETIEENVTIEELDKLLAF